MTRRIVLDMVVGVDDAVSFLLRMGRRWRSVAPRQPQVAGRRG